MKWNVNLGNYYTDSSFSILNIWEKKNNLSKAIKQNICNYENIIGNSEEAHDSLSLNKFVNFSEPQFSSCKTETIIFITRWGYES